MSSLWFCAFTIVSTLVVTPSSSFVLMNTQDPQPNIASPLKQPSNKGNRLFAVDSVSSSILSGMRRFSYKSYQRNNDYKAFRPEMGRFSFKSGSENWRLDVSKFHEENRTGVQSLPEEGLRFHQYPYSYPYAFLANNALSAVHDWKKPTTSTSTTSSSTKPTTTTDWDDWDD